MLIAIAGLQVVALIVLLVVLARVRGDSMASPASPDEARLAQLLAAQLPEKFAQMEARSAALDQHLRAELSQLRTEVVSTINGLGSSQGTALDRFRVDSKGDAANLRAAVEAHMGTLAQRLSAFIADSLRNHTEGREALHRSLQELGREQAAAQDSLRASVEARLNKLNDDNAAKLEQMRQTVDEKLNATLHDRLTTSFGEVLKSFGEVQKGLGEMNTLSVGVQDLNRLFSNVKSRGGFAEVQLGNMLEQILAPAQYVKGARVKKNSQEVVEYAVRFPGAHGDEVLLPIDAKFPRESWERLESAYDAGVPEQIEQARKEVERVVRFEAKKICEKYINEPVTTPYAIMFLPTESLYAEVLRRDGLQGDLHQSCKVMVAGPSNLYALLSSFQLGFRMLNVQRKGNEIWKVLGEAKTEFDKFGGLMDKMEKKVGEVQGTLQDIGTRSRAINRKLRDVSTDADGPAAAPMLGSGFDGLLPVLSASDDEV